MQGQGEVPENSYLRLYSDVSGDIAVTEVLWRNEEKRTRKIRHTRYADCYDGQVWPELCYFEYTRQRGWADPNKRFAYTIGNTSSYDRDLIKHPEHKKMGKSGDYEGGWVWYSAGTAREFIENTELEFDASVYRLRLPNGWSEDISSETAGMVFIDYLMMQR